MGHWQGERRTDGRFLRHPGGGFRSSLAAGLTGGDLREVLQIVGELNDFRPLFDFRPAFRASAGEMDGLEAHAVWGGLIFAQENAFVGLGVDDDDGGIVSRAVVGTDGEISGKGVLGGDGRDRLQSEGIFAPASFVARCRVSLRRSEGGRLVSLNHPRVIQQKEQAEPVSGNHCDKSAGRSSSRAPELKTSMLHFCPRACFDRTGMSD